MADYNHRSVEVFDSLLENVFSLHVEVIGRLVEDKKVYRFKQKFNHGKTSFLAPRQHFHFLVGSLATKHKRSEYITNFQTYVTYGHMVDGVEHRYFLVEKLRLVLGKITDFHVMPYFKRARERNLAHNTFDKRGLALAILSYKRYFFTSL